MNKSPRLALTTAILTALVAFGNVQAADIIPLNYDGPNEGYNDTTPVAPVGGNPGTTKGEQRQIVAQYAAALWGSVLKSDVPIYVQAQFNPLGANVLGSAGAATSYRATGGLFPLDNTWYPVALAEALVGGNINSTVDIVSQFSSDFTFYYGLDGKTPAGQVNFLDVVMHEYAHGLGFANLVNEAAGTMSGGFPDIYTVFTYDNTTSKAWPTMTNAQRQASAVNYGNVVFTGANATVGAKLLLGPRSDFRVTAPAPAAGNYSFGTASFGPAVSTSNFSGEVVQATDAADASGPTTTDGCTAITNNVAGKIALIDRGTCGFAVKVKNAQDAGAKAVIIAHLVLPTDPPGSVDTNPPAAMGGADPTITIPSIRVSQAVGNSFKANLPMQASYVVDATKWQGADDLGRPRLFMPNPVQSGSSGSHYDSNAMPNLLMEPAINASLRSYYDLDITPHLFKDIGWQLNTASAKIGSPSVADCDTGISGTPAGGLFIGATIQATNELCLVAAQTRNQYYSCMDAKRDQMVSAGILSTTQGGKMMTCAKKVQSHQVFPIF